jgi:hypothetical protein
LTGAPALAQGQETYATPEEAVADLRAALEAADLEALRQIFGPAYADDLFGDDLALLREELTNVREAMREATAILPDGPDSAEFTMGRQAWPFPVPLVREDGRWLFDSEAGVIEVIDRRIGSNELAAIEALRAYVAAQVEYASVDRDGDKVLEYAQRVLSTPGQEDGLYWPTDEDQAPSPFGPFIAEIRPLLQGKDVDDPYHGYFFKVLKSQGPNPPGGAYDYVINGNMIAGFAMLAWPAEYAETGIMTLAVNHAGDVYETDFGEETATLAPAIAAYDPDDGWELVTD